MLPVVIISILFNITKFISISPLGPELQKIPIYLKFILFFQGRLNRHQDLYSVNKTLSWIYDIALFLYSSFSDVWSFSLFIHIYSCLDLWQWTMRFSLLTSDPCPYLFIFTLSWIANNAICLDNTPLFLTSRNLVILCYF